MLHDMDEVGFLQMVVSLTPMLDGLPNSQVEITIIVFLHLQPSNV